MHLRSALLGALLCASLCGCQGGSGFVARDACRDLRTVTDEYLADDIGFVRYAGLLTDVARTAQASEDPDMVEAGVALKSAGSGFGPSAQLGAVSARMQAADTLDEVCDDLGL